MNRRGFLAWTGGLLAGAKTLLGAEPRSPIDEPWKRANFKNFAQELGAGKVIDPRAEELRSIERYLEHHHPPLRFRLDADHEAERLRLAATMPRDYSITCMSRQGVSIALPEDYWDFAPLPTEVIGAMADELVKRFH